MWVYVVYVGRLVSDEFNQDLSGYLLLRFLVVPAVFLASTPVAVITNHLPTVLAMWVILPPVVRYAINRFYPRTAT